MKNVSKDSIMDLKYIDEANPSMKEHCKTECRNPRQEIQTRGGTERQDIMTNVKHRKHKKKKKGSQKQDGRNWKKQKG